MTRLDRRLGSALLLVAAALSVAAMRRSEPQVRLVAHVVESSGSARPTFRPVEIVVSDWSTAETHRMLARTFLTRGPLAFLDALCTLWPRGSIRVLDDRDVPIRYAWRVTERTGAERIYVASDAPVPLTAPWFQLKPDAEPLVFLELRLDRDGRGIGKLSEARRLTVDNSRNVIELRDYAARPAQLVMVERITPVED